MKNQYLIVLYVARKCVLWISCRNWYRNSKILQVALPTHEISNWPISSMFTCLLSLTRFSLQLNQETSDAVTRKTVLCYGDYSANTIPVVLLHFEQLPPSYATLLASTSSIFHHVPRSWPSSMRSSQTSTSPLINSYLKMLNSWSSRMLLFRIKS